jgi:SAM-dependent methyltransferase
MQNWHKKDICRSCGGADLSTIIEFGRTPISDALVTKEQLTKEELTVPLTFVFCNNCVLAQILEEVNPEVLFCRNYPYYSMVSTYGMNHFRQSALELITQRKLTDTSLVIEAASNDGYMLRNFAEKSIPVLGIDPAEGPAQQAIKASIPTRITFFTEKLAAELVSEGKTADVFLANNVLAHVPDLNGFVEGIRLLLKQDGLAVIECPYVVKLVEHCEFDTIYHQHLCYFSLTALDFLFRRHGLYVNHVKQVAIHGGSLRLFIEKHDNVQTSVRELLENEKKQRANNFVYYKNFASKVNNVKTKLTGLLDELKRKKARIAGYGAAAKANTLAAYCGIGANYMDYICDLSKFKQGLFFSGNHLPILPPSKIVEDQPDYVLIMAWNFADEIMQQLASYKTKGGRFIIPIPEPRVVT